jgi:hypothetical protein
MLVAVKKERRKTRWPWEIVFELGSERRVSLNDHQEANTDEVMERFSKETKYGRVVLPDLPAGGR